MDRPGAGGQASWLQRIIGRAHQKGEVFPRRFVGPYASSQHNVAIPKAMATP
jgi:hypothetical protein